VNLAKLYKLPEMAADIIDRAATVHGGKSRAVQIGVEILWRFGKFPLHFKPGLGVGHPEKKIKTDPAAPV
jgi:hypothetical protein